jgi:hypothetical protein
LGLGLDDVNAGQMEPVATLPPTAGNGWEFVRLYRWRHDGPFRWPAAEVETGAFFPTDLVTGWLAARPGDFSPGFRECWEAHSRPALA